MRAAREEETAARDGLKDGVAPNPDSLPFERLHLVSELGAGGPDLDEESVPVEEGDVG